MGRKEVIIFIFLVSLFLCGCTETLIVEDLGFIHSVGYELNEDRDSLKEGRYIMTVAIPQIAITAKEDQEVLSKVAHSSKDGKYNIARKSDRLLVSGQKRTALFSKDLAEQGIIELMDSLNRDPVIGLNLHIIIVDGSVKELLEAEYPEHPRTSRYIFELIEKDSRMLANIDTILHYFMRDYYDDGIDPIAPVIKKGNEEIILDGIGLFENDKYVDKIDPKDARIFLMLHGDYDGGNINTEVNLKEYQDQGGMFVTFNTLESKRKISVNLEKDDQINVHIHLAVRGTVEEFLGKVDLSKDHIQDELERELASHIQEVSQTLLSKIQENKVDSLGIGQYVRNKLGYRKWNDLDWREVYPKVDVSMTVDVKLKGFGTVK